MQTENRNPNSTAGHGRQTPKQIPKEPRPQSGSTSRNTSRLGSTSSRKTSTPTTSKQSSVDWDVSAIQDKNTPTRRIKPVATTARKPTARGTESEMKPRLIVQGLKQQNAKLAINPSAKKPVVNASSKKPSAMKALPRTGATSSPGEADAEINLEIEYCRYIQAEVMRANSERNLELMRAEVQKQVGLVCFIVNYLSIKPRTRYCLAIKNTLPRYRNLNCKGINSPVLFLITGPPNMECIGSSED